MSTRTQIAVAVASSAVLWIAVGFVLVYDRGIEQANPLLSAMQRREHADLLACIGGAFVIFNALMTIAQVRQARKPVRNERLRSTP